MEVPTFCFALEVFLFSFKSCCSPYFWALKRSFTMGLLLQSCQAFQQPSDTEPMAHQQYTSSQVLCPSCPLLQGPLGQSLLAGLPATAQLWSIHIYQQVLNTCRMQSPAPPEGGSGGSSVLQPGQKTSLYLNYI